MRDPGHEVVAVPRVKKMAARNPGPCLLQDFAQPIFSRGFHFTSRTSDLAKEELLVV